MAGRRKTHRRGRGEGSIIQRADGSWRGAVTTGYNYGKQVKEYVYGKTQAEVAGKLLEIKQQLAADTYSKGDVVSAFLRTWLQDKARQVKPSTLEQYTRCVEKLIIPKVSGTRLDKLSSIRVRSLIHQIADTNGVAAANKSRVVLSNAYKQALRMHLVKTDPTLATDPLPTTPQEKILWTFDQAATFLDLARTHPLYTLFYLAMATGMRRGELLGLRWQDVSDTHLHIRHTLVKVNGKLVSGPPKSRRGNRLIDIEPDVVRVLNEHRQRQEADRVAAADYWVTSDLVFTSEVGTPVDPDNLKRVRYSLMDRAGVPRIGLRDLRHFYASFAIHEGADVDELARYLGHSRSSITLNIYTHQFAKKRTRAAVSLTSLLEER
jgi:integrase